MNRDTSRTCQHRAARHSDEYARIDTPVMSNNDVSTPDTIPPPLMLSDSVNWRSPVAVTIVV